MWIAGIAAAAQLVDDWSIMYQAKKDSQVLAYMLTD